MYILSCWYWWHTCKSRWLHLCFLIGLTIRYYSSFLNLSVIVSYLIEKEKIDISYCERIGRQLFLHSTLLYYLILQLFKTFISFFFDKNYSFHKNNSFLLAFQNIKQIDHFWCLKIVLHLPMSKTYGRKRQENTGNGSSITAGNFSDFFLKISARNTASISDDFRCFPAGYGAFPATFLQDPAGSRVQNLRSG